MLRYYDCLRQATSLHDFRSLVTYRDARLFQQHLSQCYFSCGFSVTVNLNNTTYIHTYIHTYKKFITRCIVEDSSNQRRGLLLAGVV